MRKTYRFSHSVAQGGYLYAHKILNGETITNKDGLRNALNAIIIKMGLIDATVKIYDGIFFLFFMAKPSVKPLDLISLISKQIGLFGIWDEKYIYEGVYDLQEEYIRKNLAEWGFDYGKG